MSETMGTTGTPGGDGASRIDEEDKPNGSDQGVGTPTLGGEVDDPLMPFDDKHTLDPDKKLHLPRNSESQRG
ncbi:hypothetical protein [Dactylosporangium sp. NPDC051541]|uniref:hypothetical protein n=1 Tax=Dactylosporangium sp. NPDC051541 TaxID=3363977 RepID=UPI003799E5A4